MTERKPPEQRVLLTILAQATSAKGTTYLRGWLGASNLVGFAGEPDEYGNPTWHIFLTARRPKEPAT